MVGTIAVATEGGEETDAAKSEFRLGSNVLGSRSYIHVNQEGEVVLGQVSQLSGLIHVNANFVCFPLPKTLTSCRTMYTLQP